MKNSFVPRIAVVGCGAIARSFYLPALTLHHSETAKVVLVDRSPEQVNSLASEFSVAETSTDHKSVLDRVDGAIVATPPDTHAGIALDFIRAGVPVLCEKPLASTYVEAESLVGESRACQVPVGVNQVLRLYPGLRKARELCQGGALGDLTRVEIFEGAPFGWPLATNSIFGRNGSGRGVLADIGAHWLDAICWMLDARPLVRSYRDDSLGGAEAVARVEFAHGTCTGVVHLSWISKLPEESLIMGTKGYLHGRLKSWEPLTLSEPGGKRNRRIELKAEVPN